jgi:GNAT superfamily N-acetyltransferase
LSSAVQIRQAEQADVELIFSWIAELADYERARDQVTGTPALLAESLFGVRPTAEAVIAELAARPVGFALFYPTFSTWECRPGIWLEDLYVPRAHRRCGVGGALLSHLARVAVDRGCARLEWAALDWNKPALDFYTALGAERLDEWRVHRLAGSALERVANGAPRSG